MISKWINSYDMKRSLCDYRILREEREIFSFFEDYSV